MTQQGITQGAEKPQDSKVESSGLAPAARKMLEGVFQQPQFQEFQTSVLAEANKLMSGKGTEQDKRDLLNKIDFELQSTANYSDAEGYARNYLEKLKAQIETIETP